MGSRRASWGFGLVVLLAASPVCANTGPPWMFVGFFATFAVPLLLGLVEGRLLSWAGFGRPADAVAVMTVANYASAIVGWLTAGLMRGVVAAVCPSRVLFLHLHVMTVIVLIVAYAVTVFVEWPFCLRLAATGGRSRRGSLKACALVNLATYALVLWGAWSLAPITIVTQARPQPDTRFAAGTPAWVYYLTDEALCRVRLDGSQPSRVMTLPPEWRGRDTNELYPAPRLAILPQPDGHGAGLWIGKRERGAHLLLGTLPGRAVPFPADRGGFCRSTFWQAADLRDPGDRRWLFGTGFWAEEGLGARRDGRSEARVCFALGTPIAQWYARYATVLPGNLVVWQLGRHVAVLDFPHRRVGLLTEGRGPVVVLDSGACEPAAAVGG